MRPQSKVSQAGVDLIEAFEGFRPKAARLDDGRWTIGYGHTRSAREGAEISREDALILLRWIDLPPVEAAIAALVRVPLNQNQYDALSAFVFNVGVDAFGESEVLARLNEGRMTEAACALELWRKAEISGDPVVLDALIRRRAAEKALFLTPPGGFAPAPSPLVRPKPDARAALGLPARRPAEIEAPLRGERAEVRLIAPFEVEPEDEAAPTEPEPSATAAPETEQEPTVVWAAFAAIEAFATGEAPETPPEPGPEPTAEEEAPTAWTVEGAEPEPEPEPGADGRKPVGPDWWMIEALTAQDAVANASAAPVERMAEAPVAVEARPEPEAPTAWTVEATPEVELDLDEPAASSWIIGFRPPAEPAPAVQTPAPAAEAAPAPLVEPIAEPEAVATAVPEAEPAAAAAAEAPAEPAPPNEPGVREIAAAGSVLQTRALPESAPAPRPLYSSYGPMAFAVAPPPARAEAPTAPAPSSDAPTAPVQQPELSVASAALEPRPSAQSFAPPGPSETTAPAPAVSPVTGEAAPAKPLILTSPPADWDELRPAGEAASLAAEADELETPLFDEGWDGPGALSGRIVHHEASAETEGRSPRLGVTGPYILLGLIGFVAFGGALFAFSRGHSTRPGAADPVLLAWALALIGAACVGVSVYFLLKRLGGQED